MNRKYYLGIGLFVVFLVLLLNAIQLFPINKGNIQKGYLNMATMDLDKEGVLLLNGQWRFYPDLLKDPQDSETSEVDDQEVYLEVPKIWNVQEVDGETLRRFGHGTYEVTIEMDPDLNKMVALNIGDFFSAYDMFWNGQQIAGAGQVGTSSKTSKGGFRTQTVFLAIEEPVNTLTVHVSNYQQSNGGAWGKVYIGAPNQIYLMRLSAVGLQLFFIGLLFIMGWYHFILFLIRREDQSAAVFGLFAMTLGLRQLLIEARLFQTAFPNLPFGISLSMEYITFYTGVTLFAIFLYQVYKEIFHKFVINLIMTVGFGLSLIVLVTPPRVFTFTLRYFQLFTVIIVAYTVYLVIRGMFRKLDGAGLLLFGSLVVVLAAVNDLLNNYRIIDTGFQMSAALMVFIFCQAVVIAEKNAKAYQDAVYYSEKSDLMYQALNELNDALEQKVNERTFELEKKNRELDMLTKIDGLTGLYNHTTIIESLNAVVASCKAPMNKRGAEAHVCIAMLDIDHFKRINDTYGHPIGDQVLKSVSETINACTRQGDILGRYGGEEFLLVLPHTNKALGEDILERIRRAIESLAFAQEDLKVTISGGLVVLDENESAEKMIKRADTCLYKAKNNGRNQIAC